MATNAQDVKLPQEPMKFAVKIALAIYFFLLGLLLIFGIIIVGWGNLPFTSKEVQLAAIVALAGGLGAIVNGISSFITYAGERKLYTSWGWWYVMRPLVGAGLALLVYLAFRGGLLVLSTSTDALKAESINIFGVGAVGGLVGMFSKEATDKLKEVAEAIFKKMQRSDSIDSSK